MRSLLFSLLLSISYVGAAQHQKEIKAQLDSLVNYIKLKDTESFTLNIVYRGEDANREWKDVYDPAKPEEIKAAKLVLEKMKTTLSGCSLKEFDTFTEGKETEGKWYVFTYACGASKKIHFAFLKIKGKYALGDIDIEEDDE